MSASATTCDHEGESECVGSLHNKRQLMPQLPSVSVECVRACVSPTQSICATLYHVDPGISHSKAGSPRPAI